MFAFFATSGRAQSTVINAPTSSTTCSFGNTCTIQYVVTEFAITYGGQINIQYQLSGGSWTTITTQSLSSLGTQQTYNWTVPTGLTAGSYRIRVGQYQANNGTFGYYAYSDYFSINSGITLNIEQPLAGTYAVGEAVNVVVDTSVPYELYYQKVGSSTQHEISLNGNEKWFLYNSIEPGDYYVIAEADGASDQSGIITIFEPVDGLYSLNFVRTKTSRIPVSTEAAFDALTASSGNITDGIAYADGLGKARQSISLYSTPSGSHMVNPVIYDEIGVQTTSYQAYPTSDGASDFKVASVESQLGYYNSPSTGVTANSHPYSKSIYEKSPLLTVKEQGATGYTYQPDGGGKTVKTDTRLNTSSDDVIHWVIESDFNNNDEMDHATERTSYFGDPNGATEYGAGELVVTMTTDEDGNQSEVFTDREGREVLKVGYQDTGTPVRTYYVYDDFGNLRFIIPPVGVEKFLDLPNDHHSYTLDGTNGDIRGNWLTEMKYDEYGRVVEKKIPEADWVYTVYDKLGRVALTQDGNMRENNDWFFTKYDIRGRTILTGLYQERATSRQTRAGMQAYLNDLDEYWEKRTDPINDPVDDCDMYYYDTFEVFQGYTNDIFPRGEIFDTCKRSGISYWSVTYYDDYDFDNDGTADESFSTYPIAISGNNLVGFEQDNYRTDGQVTGGKTRVLTHTKVVETNTNVEYDSHDYEEEEVYYIGNNGSTITLKPGFSAGGTGQRVVIGNEGAIEPDVFDEYDEGTWLEGVTFYDKYGHSIYTKSTNHVGGQDEAWTLYKFDGLVQETYTEHQSTSETVTVKNRFEYDTQGRLSSQYYSYNGGAEKKITGLAYNELGQLIWKGLSNDPTPTNGVKAWSQSLNYTYHQRGWLESVNDPSNLSEASIYGNDLFAYRLSYDSAPTGGESAARYNGNITNMEWADGHTGRHMYSYTYDGLSQLTQAEYRTYGTAWSTANEYNTAYGFDVNGNITSLTRKSAGNTVDQMGYTLGLGNQIDRIDDAMSNSVGFNDNGNKQAGEYLYDTNGNMTEDLNKGIKSITYNYMNLPEVITIKNPTGGDNKIVYTYDAAGTKLSQHTYPASGTGVATDYSAGFVYEDDALAYFPFSEGTVRKISSTSFRLEYNLSDHLGNVRATFYPWQYNSPSLLQADSYYPFGLKMPGLSYVASGTDENTFTYNGKELEDEFGLDWYHYGVRFYDPAVGRWWVTDPVDQFHSPYTYVGNNPIMYVDPDGAVAGCPEGLICDEYGNPLDEITVTAIRLPPLPEPDSPVDILMMINNFSEIPNIGIDELQDRLASYAELAIGKPYVYGGDGPDEYDCSGTICFGLRKLTDNPSFDQRAIQLYEKWTVTTDQRARGVLIFYDWNSDGIFTHVTIMRNSEFIVHASDSKEMVINKNINELNRWTTRKGGKYEYRMINWSLFKTHE